MTEGSTLEWKPHTSLKVHYKSASNKSLKTKWRPRKKVHNYKVIWEIQTSVYRGLFQSHCAISYKIPSISDAESSWMPFEAIQMKLMMTSWYAINYDILTISQGKRFENWNLMIIIRQRTLPLIETRNNKRNKILNFSWSSVLDFILRLVKLIIQKFINHRLLSMF